MVEMMGRMRSDYEEDIRGLYERGLDLSRLAQSNILVTGSTGLIGGCLTDVLMLNPRRDYRVFAAGRNEERARKRFGRYADDPAFRFIAMNVTEPVTSDVAFDYIIHAASNAGPKFFQQQPVEVIKANIDGVSRLMDYGLGHGMKRMLYVSSGEIYGEGDGQAFTERMSGYVDCASVRACYPSSKRAAETLCVSYAHEYHTEAVIARLCHTFGPCFAEHDDRVYAQFFRNALRGEDIVLKSKGGQYRSWIYVVDAAHALLRILLNGENGQAYNVADPDGNVTIAELAQLVAEAAHTNVVFDIPDSASQGNTTPITKATFGIEKIRSLGWEPLTPLRTGIAHSLQSHC